MQAIRRHVITENDGELVLRGVPLERNQEVEVIILAEQFSPETAQTLALLQNDPGWTFLRDPAEDIYSEDDLKSRK